ncbi:MAG: hypothetical protein VKO64_08205 [Candidatus Sericytochromatia bacterium]|nr:hypothetical protein [Candidatus Sericytochromatia bacterium]
MAALRHPSLILAGLIALAVPMLALVPQPVALAAPMTIGEPAWDPVAGVVTVPVGGPVAWVQRTNGPEVVVELLDARLRRPLDRKVATSFGALGLSARAVPGVVPRVRLAFRWPAGVRPDLVVQEGPGVLILKPGVRRAGEAELETLPGSVGEARPVLRTPDPRPSGLSETNQRPVAVAGTPEPTEDSGTRRPGIRHASPNPGRLRPRSVAVLFLEQVETLDQRANGLQAGYPFGPSQAWIEHWWTPWLGTSLSWRQLSWTARGPAGLVQRQDDRIQAGVGARWALQDWIDLQLWGAAAARQSVVVPEPPRSSVDPSLGAVVQVLPLAPVTLRLHGQAFVPGADGGLPYRAGADLLFEAGPTLWSFGYDHDEGPTPGGQQTILGALRLGLGWTW